MRLMYQRFSGTKGFTSEDLRETVADLVGPQGREDMRRWLVQALETTQELDYREALRMVRSPDDASGRNAATVSRRGRTNPERQDHRRRHSPRVAGRRCRRVVAGRDCGHRRRAGAGRALRRAAGAGFRLERR